MAAPTTISIARRRVWVPGDISSTQIDKFRLFVNRRRSLSLQNYNDLHKYSTDENTANDFWVDLFIYLEMKADKVPQVSIAAKLLNQDIRFMYPPPIWFPGIKLNFAENLMSNGDPSKVAIHACTEGGSDIEDITWGALRSKVRIAADAMISSGINIGDRVAGILSNRLETVVLCLATLTIGAIWSTSSPDMGFKGIVERLKQIRPKLVFAESDNRYNATTHDLMPKNRESAQYLLQTTEFSNMVVIPRLNKVTEDQKLLMITWHTFLKRCRGRKLEFAQLPFNHPGFIVYSSGTTGAPKCIVHSAAGMLIQSKKDSILHFDVRPGDTILQYSTTGWIMWAKVLCGLVYGGPTVLYEGSPLQPDPLVLLRLVSKLRVTLLGTSARFLTDLKASGLKPKSTIDLSCLRTVTSTGSTLTSEVSNWFYDEGFPPHIYLVSSSGGTDMACSLVSAVPTMPIYSGEIQCESLGMATDVADTNSSRAISIKKSGRAGELICRRPFPSQPVMFWGEGGARRYYNSYYEKFGASVWVQGDFVQVSPDTGGYAMLGRSDGVLNPSGVRFGSAEIYEVVENIQGIADSICVGQRRPHDKDETVVLFVKLESGTRFTPRLRNVIKKEIRNARSPRHVPKYIFEVADIPYTANGKKVELAVKSIISSRDSKPSGSVRNPDSLDCYKKFYDIEKAQLEENQRAKL